MPTHLPPPADPRAALGVWAEDLAAAVLAACGYEVLDRRFRVPGAEIDLVVRRRDVLAFVEVKTRRGGGPAAPECFVGVAQRRRIRGAALRWLAERRPAGNPHLRFDVVAIVHHGPGGGVDLRHLPDAF